MNRDFLRKLLVCCVFGLAPMIALVSRYGLSVESPRMVAPAHADQPVNAEVDVSDTPGEQAEVSVAIDPGNARNLLAGSDTGTGQVMEAYGSTDGGTTWE